MTNASMLRILAHATPTPTSRSKGQSQSHGAGAYCGGHLAAQLVYYKISNIKEVLFGQKNSVLWKDDGIWVKKSFGGQAEGFGSWSQN